MFHYFSVVGEYAKIFPIIKYLISRNSYVGPIWIFIFGSDQTQINSARGEECSLLAETPVT
jgi:hypothetical protein